MFLSPGGGPVAYLEGTIYFICEELLLITLLSARLNLSLKPKSIKVTSDYSQKEDDST
jgi:hypothetical protein